MAAKKKGYTAKDMREVSDSPEWTAATIKKAKPFADAFSRSCCVDPQGPRA